MAPPRGLGSASAALFSIISLAKAGSLKDIDHVVLFMQGTLHLRSYSTFANNKIDAYREPCL